jgi:eukaryotic-like serine/threonine-protein kinase
MPRNDADRNLLFGILAQQMDFVTRDALFEAMNAWIIRKETPLGVLLVERGDLASSRRDLLEALVDEHVHAHRGDPAISLQALSAIGSVADDLGRLPDTDLQASIGHLRIPETNSPAGDPLETRDWKPLGQPTNWNGRFRVVRPHARGGLGVVSVALDDELDREVAFKEIHERYSDDCDSRARFVLEAEITGKLEHPGIIPIYSLGRGTTGRPFYAMRFIRGDSLADAINHYHDPNGPYVDPARRSMQLRELLGRFLDICDALAYAHSRGVIHRDLKPSNVMLGPFGETLVVDWGLALPLERVPEGHESPHEAVKPTKANSASLLREKGMIVGTPAYMPPEQVEGAIDRLGPRSDVYGLGAILFELLTGKRPAGGENLEQILHAVGHGEIKPPRQVRPEVPLALEAICLKAISFRPEDRYPSARALAADVKAWLADEPISARREPVAERARRWAKRHRTAVTAAGAALLVGLIGLGAVAAVQTKARHDLDRKNAELFDSNVQVAKANADLTIANAALEVQRRRAEDREAQAIDAVNSFRDAVANEPELKNNPALHGLRMRLLKEPIAFFRSLRDRLQADRDTRTESLARLAQASFNLGNMANEIGDKQDALNAFREALAVRQTLADANPTVNQFQRLLANCHNNIGILLKETGKPTEALKAHEAALAIQQKLADANPTVNQFQSDLAASLGNIGNLLRLTGQPAEALKAHESALAIRQVLADAKPTVTQFQSDLAGSYNSIGNLLRDSGKPAESLKAHEAALTILQELVDANPTVNQFQRLLANCHNNIGLVLSGSGKPTEALKSHELALAIQQKLADANPTVILFQSDLAASHGNLGNLQRTNGKPAEALKSLESSLAIHQKLADANPSDVQFQSNLSLSHDNIGVFLRTTGKPEEARKAFESALAIQRKLADANPTATDFQSDLGATLYNLALLDLTARRFEQARGRLREAVDWHRKALTSNPWNLTNRQDLAIDLNDLIAACRGLGDSKGVAEASRELAELRDSNPAMVALDARMSAILRGDQQPKDNRERLQLGQRAYDRALHAAAAKLWADALDADPKLAEDRRAQYRYNAACAAALAGSGEGKDVPAPDDVAKAKLREQARAWLQADLAVWTRFVDSGPPQARPFIVQTLEHWREDADLAGIRDEGGLAKLPDGEREGFQALWVEVEQLLAKARAGLRDR